MICSIYKLVAERRDKNLSFRRKKNKRNYSFFKRTISKDKESLDLRPLSSTTFRTRTSSESSQIFNRNRYGNRIIRRNYQNKNEITVSELIEKLERNKKVIKENLEEMSNTIEFLKNNKF